MRVKLSGRLANAKGNWEAGDVIVVSDSVGASLVASKAAVAIQEPPVARAPEPETHVPETASIEPKESAVLPRGRGRRRGNEE